MSHAKQFQYQCDICHDGLDSKRQASKHVDKVHGGTGSFSPWNNDDSETLTSPTTASNLEFILPNDEDHEEELPGSSQLNDVQEPSFNNEMSEATGVRGICDICNTTVPDLSSHLYNTHLDIEDKNSRQTMSDKMKEFATAGTTFSKQIAPEGNGRLSKIIYRCRLCSREDFDQLSPCFVHHLTDHERVGFRCHVCRKQFPLKSDIQRHFRATGCGVVPKRPICDICGKECLSERNLSGHQRKVHKMKIITVKLKDLKP